MVRHRRHAEKADVNCDVIQAHHAITLEVRFPANNDWSRSAESVRLLAALDTTVASCRLR
jgi:hypothetical protein